MKIPETMFLPVKATKDGEVPVPRNGSKVLALTRMGICVIEVWDASSNERFIGWHPLPRIHKSMKAQLAVHSYRVM